MADKYISKGAAGGVVAVTVVVVIAASAFALQNEAESAAAVAFAAADRFGEPDSMEAAKDSAVVAADSTEAAKVSTEAAAGPANVHSARTPSTSADPSTIEGRASFYGYRFAGRPTANGETFDPMALTAAHRTLPFGSHVRVTNTANGRSVVVRINDRGPFLRGRIIDVSRGAAEKLGMVKSGTAPVSVEVLP